MSIVTLVVAVAIAALVVVGERHLGLGRAKRTHRSRDVGRVRGDLAKRLPCFVQPLVTWITGAAPRRARPLVWWTWPTVYAATLMWLVLSVVTSVHVLTSEASPLWLIVTVLSTVGAARCAMTTVLHRIVHTARGPSARARIARAIGAVVAWVLQVQRVAEYGADHTRHHKRSYFCGPQDPDMEFLLRMGFLPGLPRTALWLQFLLTLVNPVFHGYMLKARLRSNFVTAPRGHRIASDLYWALLIGGTAWTGSWVVVGLAWILPIFVILHCAALTQFASEHGWMTGARSAEARTSGRFMGDPPPAADLPRVRRTLLWMVWWVRLLTFHAAVRAVVLPFDLVHHDLHHIAAFRRLQARAGLALPAWYGWANATYSRPVYEALRADADPSTTEIWGIANALDATFAGLAAAGGDGQQQDSSSMDVAYAGTN